MLERRSKATEIACAWRVYDRTRAFFTLGGANGSLAAETFELAYKELIGAGASNQDLFVSLTSLATCHVNLGDIPRATNLVDKARIVCEDGGLTSASDQLDELTAISTICEET